MKALLILEHAPNPDIAHDERRGYRQEPVTRTFITAVVTNLKDAQSSFIAWRDANGLGAGNMTPKSGRVEIFGGAGKAKLVGRFSYNGRFWNPKGKEIVIQ